LRARYGRRVGNCCRARSCEQFFNPGVARRSLEKYRNKGLDKLERRMIASVSSGALNGMRVLEIGGGIGRIQAELLVAGADQGEIIELVPAYEPYARELARETGLAERTSFRIVDILEEPDAVEPADIVVLNRVVCCSPDGVDLTAAAAQLARQTLVLSFPRDIALVRAGIRLLNASFRLRRNPFRAYVHRPNALFAAATGAGLRLVRGEQGAFWQWAALERAA
jgi:hypothetical protein